VLEAILLEIIYYIFCWTFYFC